MLKSLFTLLERIAKALEDSNSIQREQLSWNKCWHGEDRERTLRWHADELARREEDIAFLNLSVKANVPQEQASKTLPTVGDRFVNYVAYNHQPLTAILIAPPQDGVADLVVFTNLPNAAGEKNFGLQFHQNVKYSEQKEPGTWHHADLSSVDLATLATKVEEQLGRKMRRVSNSVSGTIIEKEV